MKYIAPFVSLIQSVDSSKLLNEIEKQGKKNERVIDCLLQVRIAQEETSLNSHKDCDSLQKFDCTNVRIRGLMGMASFTANQYQIEIEFRSLLDYYNQHQPQQQPDILSMGKRRLSPCLDLWKQYDSCCSSAYLEQEINAYVRCC